MSAIVEGPGRICLALGVGLLVASLGVLAPVSLSLAAASQATVFQWQVLSAGPFTWVLPVLLDSTATLFASVVCLIAGSTLFFAQSYMGEEAHLHRFTALVCLFVGSMMLLIFCPSLVGLLLGWDGLGLSSFLLVVYYQNPRSLAAGMVTVLTSRLGDVALLLAIGLCGVGGCWSLVAYPAFSGPVVFLICLAAVTKSAQYPFSSWLPLAMAAPTPVSALVHSSTLVTAGMYLIIRAFPSVESFGWALAGLLVVGVLTSLLAGLAALVEFDAKKVVAYSTLSQLGLMACALGLGCPQVALFHLLTHALFKALLFLSVGSLIHQCQHAQDLRGWGGLAAQFPGTWAAFSLANMALLGLPFFSGFYSKHLILEVPHVAAHVWLLQPLLCLAATLTVAYSVRVLCLTSLSASRLTPLRLASQQAGPFVACLPLLSVASGVAGSSLSWLLVPSVAISPLVPAAASSSLWFLSLGGLLGYLAYRQRWVSGVGMGAAASLCYLGPLSTQQPLQALSLSKACLGICDQGWMESVSAQGINGLVAKAYAAGKPWMQSLFTWSLLVMAFVSVWGFVAFPGS